MLATTPKQPDFKTPEGRTTWIKEHAEFYTAISRKNLKNLRFEYESIEAARVAAATVANFLEQAALICAVFGVSDTFVETGAAPTKSTAFRYRHEAGRG